MSKIAIKNPFFKNIDEKEVKREESIISRPEKKGVS
jgi:hypothetical protein